MLKLFSSVLLSLFTTNLFASDLECKLLSESQVEGYVYISVNASNQVEAVEIELDGEYTEFDIVSNVLFERSLPDDMGNLKITFDLTTKTGEFVATQYLFDHSDNFVGTRDTIMKVSCK